MHIPYGRQEVTDEDVDAVVRVLKSDFLTQGPVVKRFEAAVAGRVGAAYATASNSATSSLHIACLALGVGPGDRVWTSPITFVASANCARYCGASVDFVDIDPDFYTLDPGALRAKLESARVSGTLPKVVIPVHLAGQPADMPAIHELSREYNFRIIEDASHAIGGRCGNKPVGACEFSDITVFSFHPVKIITSGEGGMAVTNDPELARKMALYNSHGITRDPAYLVNESHGGWYYEQTCLGFNYRMTDIQAALGLSQMHRLDEYVSRRHQLAVRYDAAFAGLPIVCPKRSAADYSGFHLYVIRLQSGASGPDRRTFFDRLRAENLGVNLHYIPVYRQPDFAQFNVLPADYPNAEAYYAEAVSLPLYPALSDEMQDHVIGCVRRALMPL
jgi:UDP-4-amino-4,6-dideoxy-N-acetyl-beta-L-altrosamine transaminase